MQQGDSTVVKRDAEPVLSAEEMKAYGFDGELRCLLSTGDGMWAVVKRNLADNRAEGTNSELLLIPFDGNTFNNEQTVMLEGDTGRLVFAGSEDDFANGKRDMTLSWRNGSLRIQRTSESTNRVVVQFAHRPAKASRQNLIRRFGPRAWHKEHGHPTKHASESPRQDRSGPMRKSHTGRRVRRRFSKS